MSTYTSGFVTKEIRNILMDQKIISACCEGWALYGCDVKEKDGDSVCWQVSVSVPMFGIQSPSQHITEMKGERRCEGGENFLLCDVCIYSFLRVS